MTARFTRREADRREPETRSFRYPLDPCPKVTVICDAIHVPAGYSRIPEKDFFSASLWKTEALAATVFVLRDLCEGWLPQYPLVAFTGVRHGFLDCEDRERLWERFGVPVFEQAVDDEGRIFASECEAHAGLHINAPVCHAITGGEILLDGRPTGIAAVETSGLCGCGRIGPRLLDVGPAMRLPDGETTSR